MIRDLLYRQIIERLGERLDPELFEQCAADLLRSVYPTLVPIRGGVDAGRDGAIADGEGEAFPLVATTGKDVLGNLARNLHSYLEDDGKRRKVVLATSQALTPGRKRNLEKRAEELGFILINVHDQDAMANLLYRAPEWCLELLNLTGTPPVLSVVPRTERPLLNQELIGREADLVWLRQVSSDSLLVGQPGSGKTFLLHKLTMEGRSLFVVSPDRGEIANGIRLEQPTILVVDDASVRQELLVDLRQLREELGAGFAILASCWPGDKESIAHTLNISETRIHYLDLLTRDEIVEVVKATGLYGPDGLIREIVNQAEGRPGLAVTLAHLCLQGGVWQVALGEALSELWMKFFKLVIGETASAILAAFSVGGDAGMPMNVVATELGLNLLAVRQAVVKLAAGGVIMEVDPQRLSVRPPALRQVLVKDMFFKGALSLPIDQLLAQAPDLSGVAHTLIGAKARGAAVPQDLFTTVLEQAHSPDVWQEYAWLGHDEASWILRHYPHMLIPVARPALSRAPEITIPLLLERAVGDQRLLHSTPEHPLRLIGDWVSAGYPGTGEALRRRNLLLEATLPWLSDGGDVQVGLRACQFALSPAFQDHVADPGAGNKVTLRSGYLSRNEISEIQGLWPRILDAIRTVGITHWGPVRDMVEMWAYPGRVNVHVPSEMYEEIRAFAGRMLLDVAWLAKDRPGVRHWANQISNDLGLEIEIPLDPDFETLYPLKDYDDLDDSEAAQAKQKERVLELADEWSQLNPDQVVSRITLIEQEARLSEIRCFSRWTPFLCFELAERVNSPSAWIRAMIDVEAPSDLAEPFLRKAAEAGDPAWMELASICLDHPMLRTAAASLTLTLPDPPADLLSSVLANLEGHGPLVEILCIRNQVSENVLRPLLQHKDPTIASAAAKGEWLADPEGTVRDSLYEAWREAVVEHVLDAHWLGEAFKTDSRLACDWLEARVKEPPPMLFTPVYARAVEAAVGVLDTESRGRILHQIPATYEMAELVVRLIGENLVLYRELLCDEQLKLFHLAPLAGHPEGIWIEKAKLALDAGYSSKEVALAVYGPVGIIVEWVGSESGMWSGWVARFDKLCSHEDERIRKVGEVGKAYATQNLEQSLSQERREAVYGI